MPRISGSPLGLVGLQSNDPNNVFDNYNDRRRTNGKGMVSLFSGDRIVRPFGNLNENDINGSKSFDNSTPIHSNDLYNTTISNIVDKLKGTKAALSFLDFAYLKDVGVYPNNRLMVARRFATPQMDNIMYNKKDNELGPLVTLLSWKPTGEDFLEISFGEEWGESEATFTNILNEIGGDFKIKGLGGYLEEGGGLIPLPGSTETLQRRFLAKIGILEDTKENIKQIPEGNPNLIKQAKMRKLVDAGKPGSGLKCKVSIKMSCTWEQKYIQGIDPTLAWMDIVSMVTRFGTSTSQSYGLNQNFSKSVYSLLENPDQLISKSIEAIKDGVYSIINKIKNALTNIENEPPKPENSNETTTEKKKDDSKSILNSLSSGLESVVKDISSNITNKYRERILGVINSLSGLPSTPWHITLGNPLRPVFCSGDMYISGDVNLKFGESLSFNDLPTTITAEFTLENARPWGLQEIMAKFNSGHIRVLSYANDDKGRLTSQSKGDFSLPEDRGTKIDSDKVDVSLESKDSTDGVNTSSDISPNLTNRSSNISINQNLSVPNTDSVNPDPNSSLPTIISNN